MIVPIDQYSSYAESRRELAIPAARLLRGQDLSTGTVVGFHPAMANVRSLFESGKLAVVAGVGSGRREATHGEVSGLVYLPEGYLTTDWAQRTSPSTVISGFVSNNRRSSLTLSGCGITARHSEVLKESCVSDTRFRTLFPATTLGRQLFQVACMLKSGATRGIRNRVFFAIQGGYDTHSNQLARQTVQLTELSESMAAFYAATREIGMADKVTTYTDSDFGRTLKSNKTGGSDHGWGSHQLVMGGAVAGGRVYGQFPDLRLGKAHDATGTGVWRPEISRERHATAIAAWSGASRTAPDDVLTAVFSV
jgi:uncharacterized protein (DUF1501 family)